VEIYCIAAAQERELIYHIRLPTSQENWRKGIWSGKVWGKQELVVSTCQVVG